mmetsp:Transcript_12770/g.51305  ORF Transcript_12770/g.51305 Transcript_12770/m.51305 type:complete len:317 (-) Transcript_12770:176-1126(-)
MGELCEVCGAKDRQYVCPECGCKYCSVRCYKNHSSGSCETEFAQKSESERARFEQRREVSEEEKARLGETVAQFWQGLDDDYQDGVDEATEALEQAALLLEEDRYEQALDALTPEQRGRFEELVRTGKLAVEEWQPWWEFPAGDDEWSSRLSPQATITGARKASPLVVFSAVEVTSIFCHMARLYNGDWKDSETLVELVNKSPILSRDERYQDLPSMARSCFQQTGSLTPLRDAAKVFEQRQCALRLFRELADALAKVRKNKRTLLASKKVEFFGTWVEGKSSLELTLLAQKINSEAEELQLVTGGPNGKVDVRVP